jgi:hypothetical protein
MRYSKICFILALSIILALLAPVSTALASAVGASITPYPNEGKIGDRIEIEGSGFEANQLVYIYLSSDIAERGDYIDDEVTAYEQVARVNIDADGSFSLTYLFYVPDELSDGEHREDVHGGIYYIYATYIPNKCIVAVTGFIVIDGEIELDLDEGTVGTEVEISGEGLRSNQKITAQYDGDEIDIASGDSQTDDDGNFTCTIIIPESSAGSHTITVIDESGDRPEAEFSVEPQIIIDPTSQAAGELVQVSGTGFGEREAITITLDGAKVTTTPATINTNHYGSFDGSFLVPFQSSYGTREVAVKDCSHRVKAQLTIGGSIKLSPATSPTSPGHVGMELVISGGGFIANATVTITFSNNDETIPVATVPADDDGHFSVDFTVPPCIAGSYTITATDDISTATSTFTMESQASLTPVPLRPEVADTAAAEAYFDWEDVTDPSGVSYTLQVASDADFTTIVLEREDLFSSEYTVAEEEKLEPTEKEAPYYWRVKAVDGAFNESEWTYPISFYVGVSWTSMPDWAWYIFAALGVLLLSILGFWLRKRRRAK